MHSTGLFGRWKTAKDQSGGVQPNVNPGEKKPYRGLDEVWGRAEGVYCMLSCARGAANSCCAVCILQSGVKGFGV